MKSKILNIGLILTSFGYLEWGGGNNMFLLQAEIEVIAKLLHDPASVLHPFTLLPIVGQIFAGYYIVSKGSRQMAYVSWSVRNRSLTGLYAPGRSVKTEY